MTELTTHTTPANGSTLECPLETLIEHVANWRDDQVQIDPAARRVQGILLTGTASRNGHRYTEQALREAVALYDRKPVFLDHAANSQKPHDRSTRDLVGSISQPRFVGGQLRGDVEVLDTEAGRTFLGLLAADSPAIGMSHVVLAQRGADRTAIERIHDVVSVDAVVFPATTRGFHEQQWADETPLPCSVATTAPTMAPKTTTVQTEAPVSLEHLLTEREGLQETLLGLRTAGGTGGAWATNRVVPEVPVPWTATKQSAMRQWLSEQGLPPASITDEFLQLLSELPERRWQSRLIAERANLVRTWERAAPRSLARRSPGGPGQSARAAGGADEQFIRAVRGARVVRNASEVRR